MQKTHQSHVPHYYRRRKQWWGMIMKWKSIIFLITDLSRTSRRIQNVLECFIAFLKSIEISFFRICNVPVSPCESSHYYRRRKRRWGISKQHNIPHNQSKTCTSRLIRNISECIIADEYWEFINSYSYAENSPVSRASLLS